jgi:hypothetical protein
MEMEEDTLESNFQKRFGWYIVLNRVAEDDITRHNEITTKTIIAVMNQLSYILEKERIQVAIQKQMMGTQQR